MATPIIESGLEPKAITFLVQGKEFAAELWGEEGKTPVIALHGWLDNCHSFRPLVAHLENIQLLAIDMAGHGHSEHRSADASYHIWDDVREIFMIANDMGWDKFVLIGHSRGAIIAAMMAAVLPERISRMVLLEGFWPETMDPQDAPAQLGKFVHRYLSFDGIEKGYKNKQDMIEGRQRAGYGLSKTAATLIVERNIEYRDGYYYWLTDARLRMPSPMMLTTEEADSFIKAVRCPTLALIASEGLGRNIDFLGAKIALNPGIQVATLKGRHHMHMEEQVDAVARLVNDFLKT